MLTNWVFRLRSLFRRRLVDRELDEELQFHIDQQVSSYMRQGLTREEALRRARLAFGTLAQVKEEYREARGFRLVDDLSRDARQALRSLGRAPGFLLASVGTVALGIGVSTAVFSVVDPLLVRNLPVRDPDELVVLKSIGSVETNDQWWPEAIDQLGRVDGVFVGTLAIDGPSVAPVLIDGKVRQVWVATVTKPFFSVLGLVPHLGSLFDLDADGPSLVMGYDYWVREWNADASVVGRLVTVGSVAHVVRGVAPRDFRGMTVGLEPDVYATVTPEARPAWMQLVARLQPGVTRLQATSALEGAFRSALAASEIPPVEWPQMAAALVVAPAGRGLSPLRDRYGRAAWVVMAMALLLLVVACANVSNLVAARATGRHHEFGVRRALGASRARLLRAMMGETTVVALLGTGLGLLVARATAPVIANALASGQARLTVSAAYDGRIFVFAVAALVFTLGVGALLPALVAARSASASSFGLQQRSTAPSARWARPLVAIQIGVSMTVISGAVLMVRSVQHLMAHDVGFDASRVLAVSITPGSSGGAGRPLGTVVSELLDQLPAVPDVEAISFAGLTPMSGRIVGVNVRTVDAPDEVAAHTLLTPIAQGYFDVLGVPRLAGRDFTSADVGGESVIINEILAARLFSTSPAVGRRVRFIEGARPPMTVVGVVGHSTFGSVREEPQAALYTPARLTGARLPGATLVVRSRDERLERLEAAVEGTIQRVAPEIEIAEMRTLRSRIGESVRGERAVAVLLGGFGATALAITTIGVYGVLSTMLARRTREIAVRVAIGANRTCVARIVLTPAVGMLIAGVTAGLVGTALAGRLVSALLFGVHASDTPSIVATTVILSVAVLAACVSPLVRAFRLDPATLLRDA